MSNVTAAVISAPLRLEGACGERVVFVLGH